MFVRTIENVIKRKMHTGKAIVIIGARQVGKTTLVKKWTKI
jgi:predicted AAA+ superfamily ATPase